MPTVNEMRLLQGALRDLSGTFQNNRALDDRRREQAEREALERELLGLRREGLDLQRGDAADARESRRMNFEGNKAHQERLEEIRKEANADRRAQMGLEFLGDLNRNGELTDEGIEAMNAKFNEMFSKAGLGVTLFRKPDPAADGYGEPRNWENPKTGRNYSVYGKSMLPADRTHATLTEEVDPLTGETTRRISRSLTKEELAELQTTIGLGEDPAVSPTPKQEAEIAEILSRPGVPAGGPPPSRHRSGVLPATPPPATLTDGTAVPAAEDRVRVVSPSGKVGTIPRSQLAEAIKAGYSLLEER